MFAEWIAVLIHELPALNGIGLDEVDVVPHEDQSPGLVVQIHRSRGVGHDQDLHAEPNQHAGRMDDCLYPMPFMRMNPARQD